MKQLDLLALTILSISMSCHRKETVTPVANDSDFILCCVAAPLAGSAKSEIEEDDALQLKNLNIFVYRDGELVNGYDSGTGRRTFFQSVGEGFKASELFPSINGKYDMYLIGNIGEIPLTGMYGGESYDLHRQEDIHRYTYSYSSYDDLTVMGFPKAAAYMDYIPLQHKSERLSVRQLVSRYHIHLNNDSGMAFRLKTMSVMNPPRTLTPFGICDGEFRSMAKECFGNGMPGDELTQDQITMPLSDAVLYVIENYRGDVFGPLYSDKDRNLDNLQDGSQGDKITFLEFTGELIRDDGFFSSATYRYVFGKDNSAYSLGGMDVRLDLNLTVMCDSEYGWKMYPGTLNSIWWDCIDSEVYSMDGNHCGTIYGNYGCDVRIYAVNRMTGQEIENLYFGESSADVRKKELLFPYSKNSEKTIYYQYSGDERVSASFICSPVFNEDEPEKNKILQSADVELYKEDYLIDFTGILFGGKHGQDMKNSSEYLWSLFNHLKSKRLYPNQGLCYEVEVEIYRDTPSGEVILSSIYENDRAEYFGYQYVDGSKENYCSCGDFFIQCGMNAEEVDGVDNSLVNEWKVRLRLTLRLNFQREADMTSFVGYGYRINLWHFNDGMPIMIPTIDGSYDPVLAKEPVTFKVEMGSLYDRLNEGSNSFDWGITFASETLEY